MAKHTLDPQSLAEWLDNVLPPGQFDVPEHNDDPLVDLAVRLATPPQPEPLAPAARARIRLQVLASYRQQMQEPSMPTQGIPTTWWIGLGVAIVVIAIILGSRLAPTSSNEAAPLPEVTEEPTLTETATPAPPTPTLASPTATLAETTPEIVPTAEDSLPTLVVIEGPVEAINGSTITTFGMDIEIDPNDPILNQLQIGDHIRVEGNIEDTGGTVIIVAANITIINLSIITGGQPGVQPETQPAAPLVVPPGCKITGIGNNNPRLKCSSR